MKILVTGGAGFIGSNFVHFLVEQTKHEPVVLDALTYAGRRENLPPEVPLIVGRIEDPIIVRRAMAGVDAVINFAAESHVDRSIEDQTAFLTTNVIGTGVLLDAVRDLDIPRYLQISTDEVYGSVLEGSACEVDRLEPSSPYSASKAGGDHLVLAHARTHGINASIIRGSNNYGPRQHPEKLIPMTIVHALLGEPIPVYGNGRQVRNWIYVADFCKAILTTLIGGEPGEIYNAGGLEERGNLEIITAILDLLDVDHGLIEHVADRPGHDHRYSLNSEKTYREMDWAPWDLLSTGLPKTIDYYRRQFPATPVG